MKPPKWIESVLRRVLDARTFESVMGDLFEKYHVRISAGYSKFKANSFYVVEALTFLRMTKIKKSTRYNRLGMYKNYFTITLRNFSRDKLHSLLNICGLAIGIACALVIYRYIDFELSYDSFNVHADKIYRITEEYVDDAQLVHSAMNKAPLAPPLSQQLAGVDKVVRILPYSSFFNSYVNSTPENISKENSFCFADSTFFEVFTLNPIAGNLPTSLDAPFSTVLTKSTAYRFFKNIDQAVGKTITLSTDRGKHDFTVTAIIDDFPDNSHFRCDFIASFSSLDRFMPWYNNWHHPSLYLYIKMHEKVNPQQLQPRIQSLAHDMQPDHVKEEKRKYEVQPIRDIHLHSSKEYEWEANSKYGYINIYILSGIFILLIASINFMNMATAKFVKRAREVGMRKVFGGYRSEIIGQFLTESFIYVFLAFLIALGLAELSFDYIFNNIIEKDLSLFSILSFENLGIAIIFIILLSVISGLYPSLYLSSFNPINIIKGNFTARGGGANVRKGLVTFQFFISGLLLCGTYIVMNQVNFISNKNLGFEKDYIVTLQLPDRASQINYHVFKEKLLQESIVEGVALSSTLPGAGNFYSFEILPEGFNKEISIKTLGVDENFISTYDLKILEGRNFSEKILSDQESAFIINESAAKRLGLESPVNHKLEFTLYIDGPVRRSGSVIGMIEDFHFQSLHNRIEPLVIYINKHPYYADYLSVKFNSKNIQSAIELLEREWKSFNPEKPLSYEFMDSQLSNLYESEMKISRIFNILSVISIILACLGLFGLSSYMAERMTKEIGIRKVFGADIINIMALQYKIFIPYIILANLIVWPIVWVWGNKWLNNFAYHFTIHPSIFITVLLGTIAIVAVTLSYFSYKATHVNPVKSLRYD